MIYKVRWKVTGEIVGEYDVLEHAIAAVKMHFEQDEMEAEEKDRKPSLEDYGIERSDGAKFLVTGEMSAPPEGGTLYWIEVAKKRHYYTTLATACRGLISVLEANQKYADDWDIEVMRRRINACLCGEWREGRQRMGTTIVETGTQEVDMPWRGEE